MPTKRKEDTLSTPNGKQAFEQKFISLRRLAIRWDLSLRAFYSGRVDVYLPSIDEPSLGPNQLDIFYPYLIFLICFST